MGAMLTRSAPFSYGRAVPAGTIGASPLVRPTCHHATIASTVEAIEIFLAQTIPTPLAVGLLFYSALRPDRFGP